MHSDPEHPPAKFGTVLGYAPGQVAVYSSDYASADDRELPNRHAYRSYVDDVFMGYKWQCVEFARRWMYLNKGYIFDDVSMAYDIFQLPHVRMIRTGERLPLHSFRNGSRRHPEAGCMLIWDEGGEFEVTGHVAIVTEVFPDRIRIVEQNNRHTVWPEGQHWSREIRARIADDGSYWLECSFTDSPILGWVLQTADARDAEALTAPAVDLYRILAREAGVQSGERKAADIAWLNIANEDEAAFVKMMGGHRLSSRQEDYYKYLVISETAARELKRATNELHALFLHATDYVLQHPELLERFNLPKALWSRIKASWDNRRNEMITGRFDFCMTATGIKVYEYNADSGSCHMECGKVQDKWARHFGIDDGRSAGDKLHTELVEAWKASEAKGMLHILQDHDLEETYHALFMQEAIEAAGIPCRIIRGFDELSWNAAGQIVDAEGTEVRWVWKTWAWETALDQIREECEQDDARLSNYAFDQVRSGSPRLVDVLLRKEVMVYEPLWTLIPSNKAIMAVLWMLFPDHPYLLDTRFDLSDELRRDGFVEKPIAGRCGHNISIVEKGEVLQATSGKFEHQDLVYQALCKLPKVGDLNVQVSTFSVAGSYAGACMRTDTSPLITKDSDLLPLRIVADDEMDT